MASIRCAKSGLLWLIVLNACLRLLRLARALPAAVRGPLLFCAFLRLASICFAELIAAALAHAVRPRERSEVPQPRPTRYAAGAQLLQRRQRKRAKVQLPRRRPPAGPVVQRR